MRRSGQLQRTTTLAPGKPLQRRTRPTSGGTLTRTVPLQTGGTPRRPGRPRAKPYRPTPEETAAKATVAARCRGRCESCGGPAHDPAHRVGRAQLGEWTASNLVALCRADHDWCHDNVAAARACGLILHSSQDPYREPVYLHCRGWVRLTGDGRYVLVVPQPPVPAVCPPGWPR